MLCIGDMQILKSGKEGSRQTARQQSSGEPARERIHKGLELLVEIEAKSFQ